MIKLNQKRIYTYVHCPTDLLSPFPTLLPDDDRAVLHHLGDKDEDEVGAADAEAAGAGTGAVVAAEAERMRREVLVMPAEGEKVEVVLLVMRVGRMRVGRRLVKVEMPS